MSFSIMTLSAWFPPACLKLLRLFQLLSLKWWVMSLVASILPDFKTLSNISVVLALTRPVLRSMFLITNHQIEANHFPWTHRHWPDVSTDEGDVLADIKGSRIATFHGDVDTAASVTSLIRLLFPAISLEQMV